jgi:hypothetical protein
VAQVGDTMSKVQPGNDGLNRAYSGPYLGFRVTPSLEENARKGTSDDILVKFRDLVGLMEHHRSTGQIGIIS